MPPPVPEGACIPLPDSLAETPAGSYCALSCAPDTRGGACAGFIRVAAEQGASLVPVAVLGEASTLRNLVDVPWLQLWTYKRLGFPVPYLLVGRWGITPLPRPTCLRFVVGEPIPVPEDVRISGQVRTAPQLLGRKQGCGRVPGWPPGSSFMGVVGHRAVLGDWG